MPGNPLLGEALYLTEYIERMGTGTLDMIRRCVDAGLAEPEFAVTDGLVTTIRRAPLPNQEIRRVPEQITEQVGRRAESGATQERAGVQEGKRGVQAWSRGVQAGGQAGQAEGRGVQVGLGAREVAMLLACVERTATSKELQAVAGYAGRTRSFESRLNGLLHDGLLEMTIPDRPRSPIQKYRLTDEGRTALGRASEAQEETGG